MSSNFTAAVTIFSDFGAQEIKSLTVSIVLLLANRTLKRKKKSYTLANHFEKFLHCLEKWKYMIDIPAILPSNSYLCTCASGDVRKTSWQHCL